MHKSELYPRPGHSPPTAPADVAIFAMNLDMGGAERMVVTVANALSSRGYRVDVVLANARGPYLAEVQPSVRVIPLGAGRLRAAFGPLRSYLRKERPRILYSTLAPPNIIAALATLGLDAPPRLVLKESSVPSRARLQYGRTARLAYFAAPLVYRRAKAIVAGSSGVANELHELLRIPRSQIHVVHNPARAPLAALSPSSPHPWLRSSTSLSSRDWRPSSVPVLLSVGRVTHAKGIDRLLRALASHPQLHAARALVLGEGPARADLESLAAELKIAPRVEFVGRVAEPREWMARADALVVTSHFESWGNVLIESLQVGTPIVSMDCPYGPREILDHGRHGTLVTIDDPIELGNAIVRLLETPPDRASLRRRAEEFSLNRSIDRLEEILGLPG